MICPASTSPGRRETDPTRSPRVRPGRRGYSLVEVLAAVTLLTIAAGAATASLLPARDAVRTSGAARWLAAELHRARMEALKRHANVAVRFEPGGDDYRLVWYVDGNGNGVRTAEIDAATDVRLGPDSTLAHQFPGVRFGLADGVTTLDGDDGTGEEPVRVGRSRMVSFSPVGSSTSGTVYLLGRGPRQYAVRVLGPTGRIRTLEFVFATRAWEPR